MSSDLATDFSLWEFLSYMEMDCLYKEVSVAVEGAFRLYMMIGGYMRPIQTTIQNSYFILPQDFISYLDNKRLPALSP